MAFYEEQLAQVNFLAAAIPLAFRPYHEATDRSFVYDSWIRSYRGNTARRGQKGARFLPVVRYWPYMQATLDRLFARSDVHLLVAADPAKPRDIYGWICWTPNSVPIIHFAFVKHAWRRLGVAHALATHAGLVDCAIYTFRSEAAPALAGKLAESTFVDIEEFLR